jgi:hypothetical protein
MDLSDDHRRGGVGNISSWGEPIGRFPCTRGAAAKVAAVVGDATLGECKECNKHGHLRSRKVWEKCGHLRSRKVWDGMKKGMFNHQTLLGDI